jgi:predicted phage terminase large subunit-like protein
MALAASSTLAPTRLDAEPGSSGDWRRSPGWLGNHLEPVRCQQFPHLELLDDRILKAFSGQGPRKLIVEIPVRHGKSERCDWWTPVWFLDRYPDRQVGLASHEARAARRWGRRVRDTIIAHRDQLNVAVRADVSAESNWETTAGGGMITAGVNGPFEGYGLDLALMDDPIKNAAQARSRDYRDRLWDWWEETFSDRFEPEAVVIVLMARWHPDDIIGRLKVEQSDEWDVLTLRAECEDEDDPLGREIGEALWPWRWPTERLAERKRRKRAWAARWQMRPQEAAGGIFEREWFEIVDDYPREAKSIRWWDKASTPEGQSEESSHTAGARLAYRDGIYWLVDMRRFRATPQGNERLIRQTAETDGRHQPVGLWQDPGQAGKSDVDHYRRRVLPGFDVRSERPTGSKTTYASVWASAAEAGNFKLVRGDWNDAFLDEVEDFADDDDEADQIDGVSGAVQELAKEDDSDNEVDLW